MFTRMSDRRRLERFEKSYNVEESGCWVWHRSRSMHGYGVVRMSKRSVGAHRVAWQLHRGEIPDGMLVLHRCDNPPCVNPDHLFLGTVTDNMRDRKAKGRGPEGSKHHKAKLTEAQVADIRVLLAAGMMQKDVAAKYGVTGSTVYYIKSGRGWRHTMPEDEVR